MPRTGEPRAGQLALAQRPALVRARIAERQHLVADEDEDDVSTAGLHETRLPGHEVGQRRHPGRRHISSFRTYARCRPLMYCQRISVACRTCSSAWARMAGVSECCSTI